MTLLPQEVNVLAGGTFVRWTPNTPMLGLLNLDHYPSIIIRYSYSGELGGPPFGTYFKAKSIIYKWRIEVTNGMPLKKAMWECGQELIANECEGNASL
jgi:hypothetical protein